MICEYGCGQQAKYQFKNGRWCCSEKPFGCKEFHKKTINEQKPFIIKTNKLCDYGCGQQAIYQFKNNKVCCSKNWAQCIEVKRKNSETNKIKQSGENNARYNIVVSEETKQKISNSIKKIYNTPNNIYTSNKYINKKRVSNKLPISKIKKKYPTFFKVEEMRYNPNKPDEKEIQVHCKNHLCKNSKEQGGWFTPTGYQIGSRSFSLDNINGTDSFYFYCCDKCKQECPLYGKHTNTLIKQDQIKAGYIKKELYTSEEYQTWRTTVLERANYLCEYCEKSATDSHHSRPKKLEPGFVLDPDFGVACCESCHYKYGHKTGTECSTGNLANKICK